MDTMPYWFAIPAAIVLWTIVVFLYRPKNLNKEITK